MKNTKKIAALPLAALLLASAACGQEAPVSPIPAAPETETVPPAAASVPPSGTPVPAAPPESTEAPGESPPPETASPAAEPDAPWRVTYGQVRDDALGVYEYIAVTGLTPYVFAPNGPGSGSIGDYMSVSDMLAVYGAENGFAAAANAGIFYDTLSPSAYCFRGLEPDGVVIAGGVVLKSTESLDHSECEILVIDEEGGVGWADYWADADALAAGEWYYYDIYGRLVTGRRVVSAVTGFVPILVGGKNVYDGTDALCSGYDNFVNHYTQGAPRQIFGVRADGTYVLLSNYSNWTLSDAAEAALAQDCVFAYCLDGGTSVETAVAGTDGEGYEIEPRMRPMTTDLRLPTYLVFSAGNAAPVSAVPVSLRAELSAAFSPGVTLPELAGALTVTETFATAGGGTAERRLYSAQALEAHGLRHAVVGGGWDLASSQIKTETVTPNGTLFYTKTDEETSRSLTVNGNTREDGRYYDYSTGYTLETADDLTKPGEKTLLISYAPGADLAPLTAELRVTLAE